MGKTSLKGGQVSSGIRFHWITRGVAGIREREKRDSSRRAVHLCLSRRCKTKALLEARSSLNTLDVEVLLSALLSFRLTLDLLKASKSVVEKQASGRGTHPFACVQRTGYCGCCCRLSSRLSGLDPGGRQDGSPPAAFQHAGEGPGRRSTGRTGSGHGGEASYIVLSSAQDAQTR